MNRNFGHICKNRETLNTQFYAQKYLNKINVSNDFTLYMINLSLPKDVKKIRKYEDEKQTESREYFYI